MKEMEKSLGNMATKIESVKTNIIEQKATAEEQRDKDSRRNNVILYKVTESTAARARKSLRHGSLLTFWRFTAPQKSLQIGLLLLLLKTMWPSASDCLTMACMWELPRKIFFMSSV